MVIELSLAFEVVSPATKTSLKGLSTTIIQTYVAIQYFPFPRPSAMTDQAMSQASREKRMYL